MKIDGPDKKMMAGVSGISKSIIRSVIGFEEWVMNSKTEADAKKARSIDGLQGKEERQAVQATEREWRERFMPSDSRSFTNVPAGYDAQGEAFNPY